MISQKITVHNPSGLHLRPAGNLCNIAIQYQSNISFDYQGGNANAKSVLSVLGACVKCGDEITLISEGEDEEEALKALVDEIENHFNKEIVTTLVRFFMDSRFNKNGGILIFTTHYPELLDEYDRNDGIYIVRNCSGITVENLSYILTRNDIKRSDAYQSGFLEGTTPTYEAYIRLKESLI